MKLLIQMASERERLPEIVEDFLRQADILQKVVQKAAVEVVLDVRNMLYDSTSKILRAPHIA